MKLLRDLFVCAGVAALLTLAGAPFNASTTNDAVSIKFLAQTLWSEPTLVLSSIYTMFVVFMLNTLFVFSVFYPVSWYLMKRRGEK